ncbi:hypothetical protein [Thermococcus sp. 21S7]|uniref:hypothetical protein n=1 Tax=Thermococcus sp. 21S7 TaxID=1638221 RepID=UPI001438C237|nr:hypothetical protein [Thermococcus sp. 21S7]NJE60521.1 hypothetical protein [Thermococcus sp. 21S7]
MNERPSIPSKIIARLLETYPNLKIDEVTHEELNLDALADRYFSPELKVSIGLKEAKILKVYDDEGQTAYWVRGFISISTKMLDRKKESGAIADLMVIRLAPAKVFLRGVFNEKPVMAYFDVEPSEWFIDALLHAARIYLNTYGEKDLIVFWKE